MTDLRIEDIPERWLHIYYNITDPLRPADTIFADVMLDAIKEIAHLETRNAELETLASKWATDAPLSERRTLHEASVAYRKAAGIFPNPEGVKAILDK